MPKLLSAVLAIVSLAVGVELASDEPAISGSAALFWMAALPALGLILGALLVATVRRQLRRNRSANATRILDRARLLFPIAVAAAQVGTLSLHNWHSSVLAVVPAQIPFLARLVALLPFAAGIVTAHFLHRHAEQLRYGANRIITTSITDGLRTLLVVFVPFAILCGTYDVGWYAPALVARIASSTLYSSIAILSAMLALALASPLLVRCLWPARLLPPGPLRDRFHALEAKVGVRMRAIYVWRTGSGRVLNACVAGLFAPVRCVYMTDALLERLNPDELAAVYAHELCHARRRHLLWYLLIGLSVPCLASAIDGIWLQSGRPSLWIECAVLGVLLVAGWHGFGILSRQFEHEADLFGAAHAGVIPCVSAFHSLGILMGNESQRRCWRHPPVSQRIATLIRGAEDPTFLHRFQRRTRRLLARVLVFFAVTAGLYGYALVVESRRPEAERLVTEANLLLEQYESGRLRPWRNATREQRIVERSIKLLEAARVRPAVDPELDRRIAALERILRDA